MSHQKFDAIRRAVDTVRAAARGHWPEVLTAIIGPDSLTGKNTACPGCGGSDRFQFNRKSEAGAFSCRHHNNGGGDGFALIEHVLGCDFLTAVRHVAGALGLSVECQAAPPLSPPAAPAARPAVDWLKRRQKASAIWHEARPITAEDPAGRYLARRGLDLPAHADALRYHPALDYWASGEGDQPEFIGRPPALVARIVRPDGMGAGLHRIYLEPDGRKFDYNGLPCKKLLKAGELVGAAVRLGSPADGRLWVSEGIEDALTCRQVSGVAAWAALSAGLLPSIWLPEAVRTVYIGADADAVGQAAAGKLAARLAHEGRVVRIITPPAPFSDWNEAHLSRRAAA